MFASLVAQYAIHLLSFSIQSFLCPHAGRHFFCLKTKERKIQEKIMLQPALGFLHGSRITAALA